MHRTTQVTPFLTYTGVAEEAMNFYVALFPRSEVLSIERYGPNEGGAEGSVKRARFSLGGQEFLCIDSPPVHDWTFTPAVSLFVSCQSEQEVDNLYARLSEGGQVFMPLTSYPFSERFAWIADQYGVSWQLSLERHWSQPSGRTRHDPRGDALVGCSSLSLPSESSGWPLIR